MKVIWGMVLVAGLCVGGVVRADNGTDPLDTLELLPFPEEVGKSPAPAALPATAMQEDDLQLIDATFLDEGPGLEAPAVADPKDADVFDELVRDNLSLRSEMEVSRQARDEERSSRIRLQAQVKELERQLEESVTMLAQLRRASEGGAAVAQPDAAQWERDLQAESSRRAALEGEVAALKAQLESAALDPARPLPAQGSDLYKTLEQENIELKQRLATAESERLAAVRQAAALEGTQVSETSLRQQVEASRQAEANYKSTITKLMQGIPDMETRLTEITATLALKEGALAEREREVGMLKTELQRREERVRRAERTADLLERTKQEVRAQSSRDLRDMHFNTGVIYMREGRYPASEREFLKALQLDPVDADTHYNLGVLYDDYLDNRSKALQHFKAYLKFAPDATDAAQVKAWMMRLEME